ncbi:hypothetical protein D4764_03G0001290, partial [Takifugu flavidus]
MVSLFDAFQKTSASPVSSYSTNTTTPAVMSTSATPPRTDYVSSEPTYVLSVHLPEEAFKNDLDCPDTPAYKDLEKRVLKTCDEIFGGKFPGQVVRCFVKEFSPAEGDSTTQVVFGVAFNNTISKAQLPQNETLVQTLMDAANSNSNYSVNLRATSVQLICNKSSFFIFNKYNNTCCNVMSTSATPPTTDYVSSEPTYVLSVHLPEEAFKNDLNNPDTPAYKDLEKRVLKTCDEIFGGKFPGQVVRCFVKEFSPAEGDSTTQVVFGVAFFNNTISKAQLPQNETLVQTLVDAANSNCNYSVNLRATSVQLISSPVSSYSTNTTTPAVMSTSATPPTTDYVSSEPTYVLSVHLPEEAFKNDLNNPDTPAYKDLEKRVLKTCDEILAESFLVSSAEGDCATQVVFGVAFNNTISKAQLPQNETLVQTLVDAANSNSNYSVNLRATSVQLISSPVSSYSTNTTTPAVMSTSATPPTTDYVSSEPTYVLSVHLPEEAFKNDLNNPDTPAYKDLEKRVLKTCDEIFGGKFPGQVVRCFVKEFSPAEGDSATRVVFGVAFNNTISKAQLPQNETLVQTLVDAANSNSNYSVNLRATSVQLISSPVSSYSTNTTTPAVMSTSATPPTTDYVSSEPTYVLSVHLPEEAFKNDLNNPDTPAYKDLEKRVLKTCDEIFGGKFPGQVVRCFVKEFSPAEGDSATQVVFGVAFNNTISKAQLPQNETLVQTLVDAANSNSNYSVNLRATSVQLICNKSSFFIFNKYNNTCCNVNISNPSDNRLCSSEPTYVLSVHLPEEAFKNDLNNPDTPAYKDLEKRVLKT